MEPTPRKKQNISTGPRVLPICQCGLTQFFVDLRLGQFREVTNPHNYVDFDSEEGMKMCRQTGVVVCRHCRACAITSAAVQTEELRCMKCLALIEPQ